MKPLGIGMNWGPMKGLGGGRKIESGPLVQVFKSFTQAASGVDFNPNSVSGLQIYLDSRLNVTQSSNAVSAWLDQSSNAYSFAQGTAGKKPSYAATDAGYNNQPMLSFASASSQELQAVIAAIAQPCTVVVVGESTSGAGTQDFQGTGFNGSPTIFWNGAHWAYYAGSAVVSANASRGKNIFAGVFNGASSAFYINNSSSPVANGNPGTTGFANAAIGIGSYASGGQFLNGKIGLVLTYSGDRTSSLGSIFQWASGIWAPGSWS